MNLYQRCFSLGIISAAMFSLTPANAAESIKVRYKESEVTVSRLDFDTFSETGELPTDLQELIGTDREFPTAVREILNREIPIPKFIENFINGSTGEFLLLKLDETISSASGQTQTDLEALRTAFDNSIRDDKKLSFMEVIRKHPMQTIQVDLTKLEGTYNQVSGFVEKALPALEVAKGFLQDIVCDCETAQAQGISAEYVSSDGTAPCLDKDGIVTTQPPESVVLQPTLSSSAE